MGESLISQIATIAYSTIDSCFSWCRDIYRAFDLSFVGIFFAMVALSALARYILRPFIGVGASDTALAKDLSYKRDVNQKIREMNVSASARAARRDYRSGLNNPKGIARR